MKVSAKIRVSYIYEKELEKVIELLQPMLRNVKVAKNNKGRYKKAYIELKGDSEDVERCSREYINK